eukprot:CAMPEP_0185852898 /NCGR_PEP_ID=MMETSP1354-20130828/16771_1 /TAXON_ID=708628 /ORGANISM="Erythrolobus madagascarensis, Strain CCMP3276" /LENGTH=312 /DNA_ID=CAMNT_0028554269 /DNA_START=385 /DNA_END=1320 /DNA_ORIENTATION=-
MFDDPSLACPPLLPPLTIDETVECPVDQQFVLGSAVLPTSSYLIDMAGAVNIVLDSPWNRRSTALSGWIVRDRTPKHSGAPRWDSSWAAEPSKEEMEKNYSVEDVNLDEEMESNPTWLNQRPVCSPLQRIMVPAVHHHEVGDGHACSDAAAFSLPPLSEESMSTKEETRTDPPSTSLLSKRKRGAVSGNEDSLGTKPRLQCSLCLKNFTSSFNLKRHITSVHHGDRSFECEICHMRFKLKENLVSHARCVHRIGARRYTCHCCGKDFARKGNLERHFVEQHTAVKPHSCGQCDKKFGTKYNLDIHLKRTHKQ